MSLLKKVFSRLNLNGVVVTGNSVDIVGRNVYVDGKRVDGLDVSSGKLEVRVLEGSIHNLKADGSVHCGPVTGNIDAGGSIDCEDVGGNARAGGSIKAKTLRGNATAGGSISIKM